MFDIILLLPDDKDATNLKQLLDNYFSTNQINFTGLFQNEFIEFFMTFFGEISLELNESIKS